MLKVYLDSCCFCRPFDEQRQERVRVETDAIREVINLSASGKIVIISSEFVKYEINLRQKS
jgi:hypothetical protein